MKLPGTPKGIFSATHCKKHSGQSLNRTVKRMDAGGLLVRIASVSIQVLCSEIIIIAKRKVTPTDTKLLTLTDICHRVVLTITKDNVDTLPTLFKTYDTSEGFTNCKIWEVGRATSAATTFFKSMTCGRDNIEFIDAVFGYNNPCAILIREAQETFPDREFACILGIGTGLGGVVTIEDKRLAILNALKKMASSSKRVADELADTLPDDVYFRFNVTKGMEDISLSDAAKISKSQRILRTI